ncbi:hypothetical protein EDD86DRAFT_243609 [Gorgonomyces haynaldii]|nr:hypothetical protein EDD86DRAFT_243609 [Gorgonomyces haynaldii]
MLVATVRRLVSKRKKNLIFGCVALTTFTLFLYHSMQLATIFIIVPQQSKDPLEVILDNPTRFVNRYWCFTDMYLSNLLVPFTTVVLLSYIPFCILLGVRYNTPLYLVNAEGWKMCATVFGFVLFPALVLTVIYDVISISIPEEQQLAITDWHCTVNYKYVKDYAVILGTVDALCGLLSSIMSFGTCYLGSSCMMVDFIVVADVAINYLRPETGLFNGVLMSTLGSMNLILWGTTEEMIEHLPFLNAEMKQMQRMMKAMLPDLSTSKSSFSVMTTIKSEKVAEL